MFFPFFFGTANNAKDAKPPLLLFNTLSKTKERFTPIHKNEVRMYNCGPTVYDFSHIGNIRAFILADTLRRTLTLNGYSVKQVMNITDMGQLVSDGDEGEDKMTKGIIREGLPHTLAGMKTLADKYTSAFLEDLTALNIKHPTVIPRASEHIPAQIALIQTLVQKEYAYETGDGVYFDVLRFKDYGKLGGIDLEKLRSGARVAENTQKRNHFDFALWKKNSELGWESPWGKGFPGWHIECSAMAMEYLGKELDIHTGGADLIGTHHNNEIAQSECATGKPFARFWLHNEFIKIDNTKISKSLGNSITLRHIMHRGYNPLAYRYWLLTAHYRSPVNFTFPALDGVQTALTRLYRLFVEQCLLSEKSEPKKEYMEKLLLAINDDLDTPKAIALLWEVAKETSLSPAEKKATLLYFDKALGLGLLELTKRNKETHSITPHILDDTDANIPEEILSLLKKREEARAIKNWQESDRIRETLLQKGYEIEDTNDGTKVRKIGSM